MKAKIKITAFLFLFALMPVIINSIMAQPPRPPHRPPPGGAPIGGDAPIGGGTEIMILLSAAYAYKKHKLVK